MTEIIVELAAGVLAAALVIALFYRKGKEFLRGFFAGTLVIAALIYLAFAAAGWFAGTAGSYAFALESAGVLAFSAVAYSGWRLRAYFLSAGWLAHILWDAAAHPAGLSAYVPELYPGFCIGFDFVFGAFIVYYFYLAKRA